MLKTAVLAGIVIVVATASLAQSITGTVMGTVTDPSGAAVPGANVSLTNLETNVVAKTETAPDGSFTYPLLPIGRYRVTASSVGFKTSVVEAVAVSVGAVVRSDLQLEVGTLSEVVDVTATTPMLQVASSTVQGTIERRLIQDLPSLGRDFLSFALLTPTVAQRGTANITAQQNPHLGSNIPTIAGGRGESVSFTVGGLNINNRTFNTPMEKPSLDALAEITVLTNNYSAEYGQGDGQVVAEFRSGSNSLHGSAYEFFRNSALNARQFLASRREPLNFNQFGATLGGPVLRNRTFFFGSYEGTRSPSSQIVTGLYPTTAMLGGDFSGVRNSDGTPVVIYDPLTTTSTGQRQPFPDNKIPAERLSPVAQRLISSRGTPAPSSYSLPGNVEAAAPRRASINQFVIKADHHLTDKDVLTTRYSFNDPGFYSGSIVRDADTTRNLRNQLAGQTWTRSFTPSLLNEFRAGYTRQRDLNVPPVAADRDLQAEAGVPQALPYNLLPFMMFDSASGTPTFSSLPPVLAGGNGEVQQQFQIVNNLSWVRRAHSMKFGADVRRRRWDTVGYVPAGSATLRSNGIFTAQLVHDADNPNAFAGGFVPVPGTGSSLADLLLGQIYGEDYGLGTNQFSYRDTMGSLFAQDTWRVHPRLTLNLGLRWDYQSPIQEKYGRQAWLVTEGCPTPGGCLVTDGRYKGVPYDPILNPFPGERRIRPGGFDPDINNFGPRVSVNWMVTTSTVVRGGFGIFYSLWEQYQFPGPTKPPFGTGHTIRTTSTVLRQSDYQLSGLWHPLPLTDSGFALPGSVGLNQIPLVENVTPRLTNVNFAIQHQFTTGLSAEIGYAGKWGENLSNFGQINYCEVPVGAPCERNPETGQLIRHYSNFDTIFAQTTTGSNDYHSGYIRVDQRYSQGLSFSANYTWSQNISEGFDSVANDIFQGGTDIRSLIDVRLNMRRRSLLDVPHRFVAYGLYELPFGRGKPFGSSASGALNHLIGDWQASWITTFQSGMVTDVSSFGVARFKPGAGPSLERMDFRSTGFFFDPNLFTFDASGDLIPPNSFRGAGINNWDLSLFKGFRITEGHRLQLRADFFNAFNHAQFETPQHRIWAPGFGQFVLRLDDNKGNGIRPPRNIQLALRYTF